MRGRHPSISESFKCSKFHAPILISSAWGCGKGEYDGKHRFSDWAHRLLLAAFKESIYLDRNLTISGRKCREAEDRRAPERFFSRGRFFLLRAILSEIVEDVEFHGATQLRNRASSRDALVRPGFLQSLANHASVGLSAAPSATGLEDVAPAIREELGHISSTEERIRRVGEMPPAPRRCQGSALRRAIARRPGLICKHRRLRARTVGQTGRGRVSDRYSRPGGRHSKASSAHPEPLGGNRIGMPPRQFGGR